MNKLIIEDSDSSRRHQNHGQEEDDSSHRLSDTKLPVKQGYVNNAMTMDRQSEEYAPFGCWNLAPPTQTGSESELLK